jgi:ribosomal protein S18 acetylase RimI-like enzyme
METIRVAVLEDAEAISALDDEIFPEEGMSPNTVMREIAAGQGLLLERSGELLGYVLFRPGAMGDILRIAVREAGKGRGSRLLRHALGAMCGPVLLTVRKGNRKAVKLYDAFGFRVVGELETSWVMVR